MQRGYRLMRMLEVTITNDSVRVVLSEVMDECYATVNAVLKVLNRNRVVDMELVR